MKRLSFLCIFCVMLALALQITPSFTSEAQAWYFSKENREARKAEKEAKKAEEQRAEAETEKAITFSEDKAPSHANPQEISIMGLYKGEQYELNGQELVIHSDLERFAKAFIIKSNKYVQPNKSKPKVEHHNGLYVARYIEFEPNNIALQIIKSDSKNFPYLAKMTYVEKHLVCRGKTKKEALSGPFNEEGRRRITELPRYMKKKWVE